MKRTSRTLIGALIGVAVLTLQVVTQRKGKRKNPCRDDTDSPPFLR